MLMVAASRQAHLLRSVHTMRFLHFCLQFDTNAKIGSYTHSLRLMQHPIDAMLQFDANADADTTTHT